MSTTSGRFQRSEDGIKWETIDPQILRRRLAGTYQDINPVIDAMVKDGQPVRTAFAVYRYYRPEAR